MAALFLYFMGNCHYLQKKNLIFCHRLSYCEKNVKIIIENHSVNL